MHQHVGMGPSGQAFNVRVLMADGTGRPHNPMIKAGAIMMAGLILSAHFVPNQKVVGRRIHSVPTSDGRGSRSGSTNGLRARGEEMRSGL